MVDIELSRRRANAQKRDDQMMGSKVRVGVARFFGETHRNPIFCYYPAADNNARGNGHQWFSYGLGNVAEVCCVWVVVVWVCSRNF